MKDGNLDTAPESAVRQVAALKPGESYCRSTFLPAVRVTPENMRRAKRDLAHLLSPVIARAKQLSWGEYRLLTIHGFTKDYDVIVAAVIMRQDDGEEL